MTDLTLTWEGERAPFAKAFVAAQMATEAVKKASTNPAFRSKYADLAGVVEAVVPALNAAGIGVIQSASNDGEMVGITTTLLHESGSSVTGTLHLRPSKSDPQGVGSAITYGRRYSLLAMTGAAPEDDDGQAASGPREAPQTREPVKPVTPTLAERANRLEAAMRAKVGDPDAVQKAFDLGAGLCAELDQKNPERLAELTALLNMLLAAPEAVPMAAE
jgi:hypothetical protein